MTMSAGSGMPDSATGRIVSISDVTAPDSTGNLTKGKNVTWQRGALSGTIFVPNTQFDPDTVKQLVMVDAQRRADVSAVTF